MKKTIWLLAAVSVLAGWACTNIGYKKTKSGLEYKIFSDSKSGASLKKGDFVKFNYKITYKDSTIMSSYEFIPGYAVVDSNPNHRYDFSEFLQELKVGDSAIMLRSFDSLVKMNPRAAPPYMKKGDKQKMTMKILSIIPSRDSALVDYQNEIENFKNSQVATIEKYLNQKGIKADKLPSGVFVTVESKGTGPAADSGKIVSVKYNGYNFAGKFFDSNIDSTKQVQKHPLEPFSFVAKQQGAIVGMMEGVTAFNQGGKGKLYIPSILGYGPQGDPPVIGPNENLIFDIEIVEVKDMPQRPQPQMPQVVTPNADGQKPAENKKKK